MKTLILLIAGALFSADAFAAETRSPDVVITNVRNYEITVDGRRYDARGNTIRLTDLREGRHSIRVYERRRGLFGTTRKLVSSSAFNLRNRNVMIRIENNGRLRITETGVRNQGRNDRDWRRSNDRRDNGDWRRDDDRREDRDWRKSNDRKDRKWPVHKKYERRDRDGKGHKNTRGKGHRNHS